VIVGLAGFKFSLVIVCRFPLRPNRVHNSCEIMLGDLVSYPLVQYALSSLPFSLECPSANNQRFVGTGFSRTFRKVVLPTVFLGDFAGPTSLTSRRKCSLPFFRANGFAAVYLEFVVLSPGANNAVF